MTNKSTAVWATGNIEQTTREYFISKNRIRRLQNELNWARRMFRESEQNLMAELNLSDETIEWVKHDYS